jgi:hypothetical protein
MNKSKTTTADADATASRQALAISYPEAVYSYLTVDQFAKKHQAFPVGTLRHQIFHEATNGLKESGAIVRNGRRVLIREDRYFAWLEAGQKKGA